MTRLKNMISSTGKLLDYRDFLKYGNVFIETGSGRGAGIQRALDAGFETIFSIEAYEPNFKACQRRFAGNKKVYLVFGKSQTELPVVLSWISRNCVIFLDAHPSGLNSYGHEQLMLGDFQFGQDAIIKSELEAILLGTIRHAIILDDINGNGDVYVETISKRFPDYNFSYWDENSNVFYKDKLLVAVPS